MLNKHNLAIAKLAPKEQEGRYAINGIFVTDTDTVITDGHLLVVMSCPPSEETHAPFIMSGQDAAKIAAALPKNGDNPEARNAAVCDPVDGVVQVLTGLGETAQTYAVRPLTGSFPDYRRIVPKASAAKFKITLGPKLLKDLMAHFDTFTKSGVLNPSVELYFTDDKSPVRMDADGPDGQHMTAVLMPMRGEYPQLKREEAKSAAAIA